MRLGHLSDDLRREVWNAIRSCLNNPESFQFSFDICNPTDQEIQSYYEKIVGKVKRIPESQVPQKIKEFAYYGQRFGMVIVDWETILENVLMKGKIKEVLDSIEIVINISIKEDRIINLRAVVPLIRKIEALFNEYNAAYWLDIPPRPLQYPCQFRQRVSKEQCEATQQAIETVRQGRMKSAVTHLQQAAEHMNMGQYADSVADSIHAVESIACEINPKSNKTLGKALDYLEGKGLFPEKTQRLMEALKKLHGYANQPGIRHGKQEGCTVDVGLDEAILMYGACASFAAYLTRKHQQQET